MAERNILAYYNAQEQAEGALRKLQALRVIDARIDRFGSFPGSGHEEVMNPLSGDIDGLGTLALSGDFSARSSAIMAAADPDASGLSDKGDEALAGKDVLLTAVVSEEDYEKAMRIVRETGGLI